MTYSPRALSTPMADPEVGRILGATRESVALEPFREEGYRRQRRVHTALGNRAEALRIYERCRAVLVKALGTDPSPETQAVSQALRT